MTMSYWWGRKNPDTGKDVLSERGKVEAKTIFDLFKEGSIIHLESNDWYWSEEKWAEDTVQIIKLDYGFETNNQLYFLVTFRFQKSTRRSHNPTWEDEEYTIKVVFLHDHPAEAPKAFPVGSNMRWWSNSPHRYGDGSLCLFKPSDGRTHGWDPARSTGATIISWSIQWVQAFRHWQQTNRWPGEDGH